MVEAITDFGKITINYLPLTIKYLIKNKYS